MITAAYRIGTVMLATTAAGMTSITAAALNDPAKLHAAETRFEMLQQSDASGSVQPDGLVRAIAQRKTLLTNQNKREAITVGLAQPQQAGISSSGWTALGPGNIGGRIRAFLVDPRSGKMFVGAVDGGIWVSSDGGMNWIPVNDFMGSLAVCALTRNPLNGYLYAGTGEGNYNSAVRGSGIFVSIDGGVTWSPLASTTPSSANPQWYYINRIAINPNGVMLAATNMGVYRSTDGGTGWTRTSPSRSLEVAFDPSNPSDAMMDAAPSNYVTGITPTVTGDSVIAYSSDAGATWTPVTVDTNAPNGGHVEFAYSTSNPGTVYASVDNDIRSNPDGRVYKSADGGHSWTLQSTPDHLTQGWYANTIWVDPANAAHLIIGGLDLWQSSDSGASWTRISDWAKTPRSPHADQHVIFSDPGYDGVTNRKIYFATDGGLYQAADLSGVTSTTTGWTNLNNGLAITQFYSSAGHDGVTASLNNNIVPVIGGAQDNGMLLYSGNVNGWTEFYGGDGGICAVDPSDGNYAYGEYTFLTIARSTDGGRSAAYIYNGIGDAGNAATANFIAPYVLDPNDTSGNTMLAGGASLWLSTNIKAATPNWSSAISGAGASALPTTSLISALAVAEGTASDIWVGHNDGTVYRQTGTIGTPIWTQMGVRSMPSGRMVLSIFVDPQPAATSETVYVTFGGYSADNIYRGTYDGAAWTWTSLNPASSGFPQVPVYALTANPDNPGWLYAGTMVGIFTSTDGGSTWSATNNGPANVSVRQLLWFNSTPGNLKLIAATYGRGMYETVVAVPNTPAAGAAREGGGRGGCSLGTGGRAATDPLFLVLFGVSGFALWHRRGRSTPA